MSSEVVQRYLHLEDDGVDVQNSLSVGSYVFADLQILQRFQQQIEIESIGVVEVIVVGHRLLVLFLR